MRAIHSGNFQGVAPTGKQIAVGGTIVQRIKEGRIVEHWPFFDWMGMMQQLGMVPPPQPAK
jgi:predicted ester cyclase